MNDEHLIDNTPDDYDEPDELPPLTDEEHSFLLALLKGTPANKAYETTHEAALKYTKGTINNQAYRLKHSERIQRWLAAITHEQFKEALYTREEHLKELDGMAKEARSKGNYGAAVNALISKGKAAGHYNHQLNTGEGEITGADAVYEWITKTAKQLETKH